jgi:hypothetical protein
VTKAQTVKAAVYRDLGLGYEIAGMVGENLAISRPLRNGRPGICYQLIKPDGMTIPKPFIRYS